jgi:hypothetical protein
MAARVEAGFVVLAVPGTSVLDDAAVDVEPRVSLTCWEAWKRETVVFNGAPVVLDGVGVSAAGSDWSRLGPGVGGGEINATFFWISTCAALELPLLLFVLRELRPAESESARRGATSGAGCGSATGVSDRSCGGSGTTEPAGVGFAEESADEEVNSSDMGGSGLVEISGSGL